MFIAKSEPIETLKEHTNELRIRYEELKKYYEKKIKSKRVWDLLQLAVIYHDTGKAYSHFQYRMRKLLGEENIKTDFSHIPHNYLSPFFLPLDKLALNKHDRRILIEAIAYHHEREYIPDPDLLVEVAEKDLIHKFTEVSKELDTEIANSDKYFLRIAQDIARKRTKYKKNDDNYLMYVLVKGLLHRLDHAASAHVPIEIDYEYDLANLTINYLKNKTNDETNHLRPLQKFALKNQDKNLILIAQTGMGKTEAALIWAGKKKTFFTVPLRVSLNALFDRVSKDMGYANCGLLHSTSAHHLSDNGYENWEVIYDQSKYFSNKLTFTTIDQILKFPFKFKGYEKYYATFSYSCVVIDEIQAYNPWIVAVLIKAIEMIHALGGQFMIMTATLPKLYLDKLQEKNIFDENCIVKTFVDDKIIRHRYKIIDSPIIDNLENIVESAKNKKVLVIVNTVDQANELYEQLKVYEIEEIHLLHARFIQKHRQLLEGKLKDFDKDRNKTGIWVTTQIVEASIDIDFDELHTELSPLDSLFQRFGRCYRKRSLDIEEANIFIYTKEVSGFGSVYDTDIMNFSENILKNHANGEEKVILESIKIKMVEQLYSKEQLKETNFYKEFEKAMNELDVMEDHVYTFEEAQKQLRDDRSVMVIPRSIYDKIIPLFEELELETDKRKRTEIRREIEFHSCSVSKFTFKKYLDSIEYYRKTNNRRYRLMDYVYVLDTEYDFDEKTLRGTGVKKGDSSVDEQFW